MTPPLRSFRPIPYISSNPAISFPILIVWLPLSYLLARSYLKTSTDPDTEGMRLGVTFAFINFIFDLLLLVLLLRAGFAYFISLTDWFGYFLLFAIPWLTGRSLQTAEGGRRIEGGRGLPRTAIDVSIQGVGGVA